MQAADTPLLEIRHVTRRYNGLSAVEDVTLEIGAGEFFTLLGPSGCGKTTLLRMIAGFEFPDAGQILLDGVDLAGTPPENRPVHTVFQSYALFPHMTVEQNVAFPLKMAGRPPAEIARLAGEALAEVHLGDKARQFPHELSGGQKQRVALARGIVNRPRLLLLDEPLGALDAKLRVEMQLDLIKLQRDVGITFIFVTHAQQEALALSDRIAVMNLGRVEQVDEPSKLYGAPKSRFVADFIGNINMFACEVIESTESHMRLRVEKLGEVSAPPAAGVQAGQRGSFALRPEQAHLLAHHEGRQLKNHFAGRVRDFLYSGDVTTYVIDLECGVALRALLPNAAPGRAKFFEVGDAVSLEWRHDAGIFLGE